jgi:hypothetical protein
MYLVLIAWLYVTLMMAVAEATSPAGSVMGAIITFTLYGLLPMGIVGYILGTPGRKRALHARAMAERAAQTDADAPPQSSQMQAAMRPLPPKALLSRRCEKNRDGCDTVHQPGLPSLPYTCAMPSACRRWRASAARLARNLPGACSLKCCAAATSCAQKASRTSEPTSKACGPMHGPSQASVWPATPDAIDCVAACA